MSVFQDLISQIGENIADYSSSIWNNFLQEAQNEIDGLANYYLLGNKKVSMLNSNLIYIQNSVKAVNGIDGNTDRADFTYYSGNKKEQGQAAIEDTTAKLASPSNDLRGDVADTFNGVSTTKIYSNEGNVIQNSHYAEKMGDTTEFKDSEFNEGVSEFDRLDGGVNITSSPDLLSKTNKWMRGIMDNTKLQYITKRFDNTISRFHTDNDSEHLAELENSVGNSSYSKTWGMSHGRNLLKKEKSIENDYDDPYCRVWTWHHQYAHYKDTMRPVDVDSDDLIDTYKWQYFRGIDGIERLAQYGTLYNEDGNINRLVNITPKYDSDGSIKLRAEKCMFSIENLAWKGQLGWLSNEQKGPLGGRIMWFPPYDLKFSEQTNASWDKNVFIGRGEPMYTYSNTERSGSLSFKLLIDHPAILDYWDRRNENDTDGSVDDTESKEQQLLRFFAGCDWLTAKLPPTPSAKTEPVIIEETPEPIVTEIPKSLQFFVFFPNNYSGKDDGIGDASKDVDAIKYLVNGIGAQKMWNYSSNTIVDMPISITDTIDYNGVTYGGYEMRDKGISVVTNATETNAIVDVTMDGKEYRLMKMYDEKTKKGTAASCSGMSIKKQNEWHKGRYYYRADNSTLNQTLVGTGATSYIDKSSTKLNSTGYEKAISTWHLSDSGETYSFANMFMAMSDEDASSILNGLYDENKVDEIQDILAGNKGTITEVICKGHASSQGNNKSTSTNKSRNTTLATNRAKTIQKWVKSYLDKNNSNSSSIKYTSEAFEDTTKSGNMKDSSDAYAKLNRFVFVEIKYTATEVEDAADTSIDIADDGTIANNTTVMSKEESMKASGLQFESGIFKDAGDGTATATNSEISEVIINPNTKFDREGQFFDRLKSEDPVIFKKISEKIKYFDPAFHSMTPEGFNARLTFLQQCMRQGPTISNSDSDSNNATNLAFGMAPVCVLRVGDFYNTKIIINNINIEYDPMTWDLNQEGIGVMPMIANVTLSFNFIGGSDLGGPIARLQNALSFNYYSNTGAYDYRAEKIDYDKDTKGNGTGAVKSFEPWEGNSVRIQVNNDGTITNESADNEEGE